MRPSKIPSALQVARIAQPLNLIALACVGASAIDKAALAQCLTAFEAAKRWRDTLTEADRRRAFGAAEAARALAMAPDAEASRDTQPRKLALAGYAAALARYAMGEADANKTFTAAMGAAQHLER